MTNGHCRNVIIQTATKMSSSIPPSIYKQYKTFTSIKSNLKFAHQNIVQGNCVCCFCVYHTLSGTEGTQHPNKPLGYNPTRQYRIFIKISVENDTKRPKKRKRHSITC